MFVQSATIGPDGSVMYQLGVVCRGEENKDWSAATPSGNAKFAASDTLDAVWTAHLADRSVPAEVLVYQEPTEDGEWKMDECSFTYGGCAVKFHRVESSGAPYGQELSFGVNASAATKALRAAYAAGLDVGKPPRFTITVEAVDATGQA
jgi:hypothetical protein